MFVLEIGIAIKMKFELTLAQSVLGGLDSTAEVQQ